MNSDGWRHTVDKQMERSKHKIAPRYGFGKISDEHQMMKCFHHRLNAHQLLVCVILHTKQEVGKIQNINLLTPPTAVLWQYTE